MFEPLIGFFFFFFLTITQLGSGQTPGELLTPLVLNSILSKALQYSLHGDTHLARNFTFALRFLPETFHPHAPDSLNCLELRYKVSQLISVWVCLSQCERQLEYDNLSCFDKLLWSGKITSPPQDGRTCRLIGVRSSGGVCSDSCCTHCTLLLLFVYPAVSNNFSRSLNLPLSFSLPLSHSILPSQSSHLLYQHLCTHTFPLPSPHRHPFFPAPVPLSFFHTCTHTFVHPPHPTPPLVFCLISFVSSPRWTGR